MPPRKGQLKYKICPNCGKKGWREKLPTYDNGIVFWACKYCPMFGNKDGSCFKERQKVCEKYNMEQKKKKEEK